jgi:hypothetical protein
MRRLALFVVANRLVRLGVFSGHSNGRGRNDMGALSRNSFCPTIEEVRTVAAKS